MLNFSELKTNIAEIVQRSGDSSYVTLIGDWVNTALLTLYNSYDYFNETQDIHNFTTVASQEQYAMPLRFNKPLRVYDLTNDKKLSIVTEEGYFDSNIANIADATEETAPSVARLYGSSGVQTQVSTSGDTVQAKSSVTESVTVRVEGYIDSALTVLGYENIAVTGATAVAGTTTFYKITHFSKSADTTGFITLENSSGTDLAVLGATDRIARYKLMNLGKIPSQANSMRVLFKRNFPKLVNDYDYPFVEADDYLTYMSVSLALQQEKESVERAVIFNQMAERALAGILTNQQNQLGPDYQNKMVTSFATAHRA